MTVKEVKEMPEIKFADSFEINIEKIVDFINFHMNCGYAYNEKSEIYEFYNEADERQISFLEERINNVVTLDEEFKKGFAIMAGCISNHAFENGLRIGLSLLRSLLTAEIPEIHVVHHETPKTDIPVQPSSDLDSVLVDYLQSVIPYLKSEQKISVYSDIKSAFLKSTEETLKLF